jgi:hypothetical protein
MFAVVECEPNSALLVVEPVDVTREPFFADLERLYTGSTTLPMAAGRVVDGRLHVTARQEYIAWAKRLGKPARVLVSKDSEPPEILGFAVRIINRDEARKEEESPLKEPAWQIYRFVRPLSAVERTRFSEAVQAGLSATGRARLCSDITFFDQGRAVELEAFVPPFDDESRRELQAAMLRFSFQVVRITAFNGHGLGPPTGSDLHEQAR